MIHAGIVGSTGYGALELVRLLQFHPHIEITSLVSQSHEGEHIADMYPHMNGFTFEPFSSFQFETLKTLDIVFFATPAGIAKNDAPALIKAGVYVVDLSGDFRLHKSDYENWYQQTAAADEFLTEAEYGLPELNRDKLQEAALCSNPGCFATSALLGLLPAANSSWINPDSVTVDGKTGLSGAGRTPSAKTHFSETNENTMPYKIGKHQHIPEIERYLMQSSEAEWTIQMSTHLIPMTRGLLCSMYAGQTDKSRTTEEWIDKYREFYRGHPFVRIHPYEQMPATKFVLGSNYCDIGIHVDQRTKRVAVFSALDNLMKGASGQAIQNANLMLGLEETCGLQQIPIYP
ncbi:N-acetyl-gamma-glutamyl-phosphate reductase [Salisediminibacterium halotolerans]|uniref:N-acetyl-gamma-glutamyl-phosphate reductase n=1 Tax=Salisediminibacterium halotolerans TaxID=517425 RepID=UPI000EB3E06C|nr:N-acetyl-gamma-glutamyl-phosphate reductase [Salisediminibacterium halotolerans]RLJ81026.1 N-acetyl-gamma-glutamyl-phosphate reductase [Actinophytocola xinjiangensis]RPE87884.1 N-acetyl-gamma-glutamyl-phosphate reductase [Salisediminibacterium halotolerans]TWG37919.1 N-acetyl-gamma-glutamyl-phosphate reductase [Salisediminibacterium halotolerans]GEL08256.1 N-acetyl-gamma-glutamyl-phosphate reductase [Salisediminibacterium halotolerans]